MNNQTQTQVLENLQDIKDLADRLTYINLSDENEINRIANEIYMRASSSIDLIYNVQLIKPEYDFKPPHSY